MLITPVTHRAATLPELREDLAGFRDDLAVQQDVYERQSSLEKVGFGGMLAGGAALVGGGIFRALPVALVGFGVFAAGAWLMTSAQSRAGKASFETRSLKQRIEIYDRGIQRRERLLEEAKRRDLASMRELAAGLKNDGLGIFEELDYILFDGVEVPREDL